MERFQISVSDSDLADLMSRLTRTRFGGSEVGREPWESGVDHTYLAELVAYWRDGFDWRKAEARLNALPSTASRSGPSSSISFMSEPTPGRTPGPSPSS